MKKYFGLVITILVLGSCGEMEPSGPGTGEELPRLSINDVTRFEGDEGVSMFEFQMQLSAASESDVTFSYQTEEGTAEADIDFESKSGSLTIAAGDKTAVLTVSVLTDTIKEADETFRMLLTNIKNATLSKDFATATIRNEDTFVQIPDGGYVTPISYPGFDLIWNDEFDGNSIDQSAWTHELGNSGWGNNELQNYTSLAKNSFTSDGNLIIEAIRESDGSYTSARMVTMDKVEFALGRIDVRAKLPEGQGIWPAIWMLGANFPEIGWPACGELDIMELVGHEPNKVHGTAHWGPSGPNSIQSTSSTVDDEGYQDDYHVFSLNWTGNRVEWLVDDEIVHTITNATTAGQNYPFNEPFFMILNVAVGGRWPGNPDATTVFPQRMVIDYVRIFQPK